MFQIGFVMNTQDCQIFEFIDYLVNFSSEKAYINLDLVEQFNKKIFEKESKSYSKIEPFRMQHVMPSASMNERFIGKEKYWENHRLVPII